MRARWAGILLAVLAVVVAAPAAYATSPVQLGVGYVQDDASALSPAEADQAEERLTRLFEDTGVDLYVAVVPEFTDPSDPEAWATETASRNGLGPDQYLLAIALDSRQYYLSADSSGPLSFDQVGDIEDATRAALRADDLGGAIDAAAEGITTAINGPRTGSGSTFPVVVVLVVVALGIVLIVWLVRRARRGRPAGSPPGPPLADLERQASSALIETDDAITTSEQELGFAAAQFGEQSTAAFAAALDSARESLAEAFHLKQQLDDETPDTTEEKRAWNTRIIELCAAANAGLDEKAEDFDRLRAIERDAPAVLARLRSKREQAAAALSAAQERLAQLSERYAPEALATIADNPDQAQSRLGFADDQLTEADEAIRTSTGGAAAVALRAAEEAIGQADLLEKAIGSLADDLSAGETQASALIAELEGDLQTAGALPDTNGQLAPVIAATRTQVEAARANLAGPAIRPLRTLEALTAANEQIDAAISGVRDAAEQQRRAQQMLTQTLLQAQGQVSAAQDYITARRGAVGATARTRLAEASAALTQAHQAQTTQPQQALALAQRSSQLAGAAIQSAQNDVGGFGGVGMPGLGRSSGGGDNLMGAVLGGIVLNSLLGGGSSRSSRGGFRSGGFSVGSFGGGGSRARRGGGSFGGGSRARRGGGRF